jgi:uncharacterized protein YjdB
MLQWKKLASFLACFLVTAFGLGCGNSYGGGGNTLQNITVTPSAPSIAVGATQLFTATGYFSNGSNQDLTHQSTWTSTNTMVATVAGNGTEPSLATGVATGTTMIQASFAQGSTTVQGSTKLTVTP